MKELIQSTTSTLTTNSSLLHLSSDQRELLPIAFGEFVDAAATSTGRATFYNTRAEQEAALDRLHGELFGLDRGV